MRQPPAYNYFNQSGLQVGSARPDPSSFGYSATPTYHIYNQYGRQIRTIRPSNY